MASKRFAQVDRTRCVSCGACAKECPKGAVQIWRGCWAVVNPERCVGCGKCQKICPADCIQFQQREAAS